MCLAVISKEGKMIAQSSPALSHAEMVARQLGGVVPDGARVVSIFGNGKAVLDSMTYYGNQLPSPQWVQYAVKQIFNSPK